MITHWYCASLPGSRGQAAERLAARIEAANGFRFAACSSNRVEAALDAALADSAPDDGVLVFGSFLTAAAAGNHWRRTGLGVTPDTPTTSPRLMLIKSGLRAGRQPGTSSMTGTG